MTTTQYPTPRTVEWQNAIKAAELAVGRAMVLSIDMPDAKRVAVHATLNEAHKRIRKAHAAAMESTR